MLPDRRHSASWVPSVRILECEHPPSPLLSEMASAPDLMLRPMVQRSMVYAASKLCGMGLAEQSSGRFDLLRLG